jgi:hypothetical protein
VSKREERIIRVAVGSPGIRSGIWRVWSNPESEDVYIGQREYTGVQKVSLHPDACLFAWTDPFMRNHPGSPEPPVVQVSDASVRFIGYRLTGQEMRQGSRFSAFAARLPTLTSSSGRTMAIRFPLDISLDIGSWAAWQYGC